VNREAYFEAIDQLVMPLSTITTIAFRDYLTILAITIWTREG
jgi:hypothetical protein